jgi:hypothetical protein
MEKHEVSGHDFSRAANASKVWQGFSPAGFLAIMVACKD